MSGSLVTSAAPPVSPAALARHAWVVLRELTKARLSALVVATTLVGYLVAVNGDVGWWRLLWTVVGTALAAGAANALNEVMEADRDGRMARTRRRPIPSAAIRPSTAWAMGAAGGAAGITVLAVAVNVLTAALAVFTMLVYLLIYTPMKPVSPMNTLIGAVVGGLPPMMGWAAATGGMAPGGWILGAVLFVWQVPHFLALAWLYRRDYAAGGHRMLPAVDPTGRLTAGVSVAYCLTLIPVTAAVAVVGPCGPLYAVGAVALSAGFLLVSVRMRRRCTDANARRLFLASVIYLPALCGLMVVDRAVARGVPPADREPSVVEPASGETVARSASELSP